MNRLLASVVAVATLAAGIPSAHAQSTLERVRQAGVLRCAAEARPGFADGDEPAAMSGLAVDLCRAVAVAVIGPEGRVQMSLPGSEQEYDALAAGADLVFLSGTGFAEHRLTGGFVPGPVVFLDPQSVMVPDASPVRQPADLSGKIVCLMIGSPAQRALEETLGGLKPPIVRLSFREDVEMLDAYNVGRCDAMADDASRLAEERESGGINRMKSRLLDRPLGLTPLLAATSTGDGAWAATVGWVLLDLLHPEREGTMPVPGLDAGWQTRVHQAVGSYAQMRERAIGEGSAQNTPWPQGLLITIRP